MENYNLPAVFLATFLCLSLPSHTIAQPLCSPSLSTEQCLVKIAKQVIETGKAMLFKGDSIDVDKASKILEKAGIK